MWRCCERVVLLIIALCLQVGAALPSTPSKTSLSSVVLPEVGNLFSRSRRSSQSDNTHIALRNHVVRGQIAKLAALSQRHPRQGLVLLQKVFEAQKVLLANGGHAEAAKARQSAAELLALDSINPANVSCVSDERYAPYGCPVDPLLDVDFIYDANNYLEEFILEPGSTQMAYYNMSSNVSWDPSSFPVASVPRDWEGYGPHYVDMPDFVYRRHFGEKTTAAHTTTTTTKPGTVQIASSYTGLVEVAAHNSRLNRKATLDDIDHTEQKVTAALSRFSLQP